MWDDDNIKIIKLSSKKYPDIETMVDDEDYEILSHYKWYPTINPKNNTTYVAVIINHKITQMHRYIMQLHDYDIKDKDIDHEDQNGLNNQKYNLRPCSKNNNQHNRKKNKNGTTSKYKGVCLRKNKYLKQN